MATELDHDRNDDVRLVRWSKAHEPSVIELLSIHELAALGRSRLAGKLHALDRRRGRGAVVHHSHECLTNLFHLVGGELQDLHTLGRARPDLRRRRLAIRAERRVELRHVQDGLGVVSLSDRHAQYEGTCPPSLAVLDVEVFGVLREARLHLLGKIDARLLVEADGDTAGDETSDAKSHSQLVEVDVARLRDRTLEIQITVPFLLPAAVVAVSELQATRTRDWHPVLIFTTPVCEPDRSRRELPGGAGRIRALQCLVVEGTTRIVAERVVVLRGHATDESIAVEARRAIEREHAARLRVDRDCASLKRVAEDARNELLEIQIDVRVQVGARLRNLILLRAGIPDDASTRVHFDELESLLASEHRLILLLESLFADLLARLVVSEGALREFCLAHFADVPDERGDRGPVWIESARRALDDQPRKLRTVLLEDAHDVERRVGDDHSGTGRRAPKTPQRLLDLPRRKTDRSGEPLEHRAQRVLLHARAPTPSTQ